VNSTIIATELSEKNEEKIGKYYALFLNAMSKIAKNFRADIIKNAGVTV
jgi:hypothetical protein